MRVEIQLKETSQPIILEDVENTDQKGDMYCIYTAGSVHKYPIYNIWRIKESYN